ncbi:hypothetical protein [Hymenobacter gelipurpurascens]|uniref:hypothetical protein n=1 Tax=Hymenobacter gelipurpurascens TaxID=89968 RepID=UPI001130EF75|nr:hypothetical protein [Hymenobacter gelipurpurascens]
MSLVPLFPDLQHISRKLSASGSSVTCQHFRTELRFRWNPLTTKQKKAGYLSFGVFASIWIFISIQQKAYSMFIWLALFVLMIWGEKRRKSIGLDVLSLHNDVRIDTGTRRVLVVHLSDVYRQ